MKLFVFIILTLVSASSYSSIIYEFEEIEMFNQESNANDSGLFSGFIEYAKATDIASNTFKELNFVFSFNGSSITINESFEYEFSAVDLNDGIFGDEGLKSDNGDAEGFEFNFEFADGFVTLANGAFGLGSDDTCFFYEQNSSFDTYCAGRLISLSTDSGIPTEVSAPNSVFLLLLPLTLIWFRRGRVQGKQI